MKRELIEKLAEMSQEESRILSGERLDKRLYSSSEDFVINEARLHGSGGISVRTHTRFTDFPRHRHNYVEMMIVLTGEIYHTVEGERIRLGEGDILLMNKHISHSIEKAKESDIGVNIIMSDGFIASLIPKMSETIFSPFFRENGRTGGEPMYFHFASCGRNRTQNLIENLLIELTVPDGDRAIMEATVALLLSCLSKQRGASLLGGSIPEDKVEKRTIAILSYIEENYRTASLTDLARRLYLTEPYLSKLIRATLGKSFKELVVEIRLKKAKEMLLDTDLSIGEIISATSYDNQSYFHRIFREHFGVTPLAMRKNKEEYM